MKTFDEVWNYLQDYLKPGMKVKNWTAYRGYIGDSIKITRIDRDSLSLESPAANKHIQVVPKDDFESIWQVWPDYKMRRVRRYELRGKTRFSKYIISILRWFESESQD